MDVAELIVTARGFAAQVADANVTVAAVIALWESTWEALADEVERDGNALEASGDYAGANSAYLRAAAYYQLSERFSDHLDGHALAVFNKSTALFTQAVASGFAAVTCTPVTIPFLGVSLPGYWCPGQAR